MSRDDAPPGMEENKAFVGGLSYAISREDLVRRKWNTLGPASETANERVDQHSLLC